MRFIQWLRAVLDLLSRGPYTRMLESAAEQHTTALLQQRQDLTERLRDKDAVIQDLRIRLAAAEADVLRERVAVTRAPIPIPDFTGPVSFQDEVGRMKSNEEQVSESASEQVSKEEDEEEVPDGDRA